MTPEKRDVLMEQKKKHDNYLKQWGLRPRDNKRDDICEYADFSESKPVAMQITLSTELKKDLNYIKLDRNKSFNYIICLSLIHI